MKPLTLGAGLLWVHMFMFAYSTPGAYYLFYLQDGRLCEVGADSRLGAYSNKYGSLILTLKFTERCK